VRTCLKVVSNKNAFIVLSNTILRPGSLYPTFQPLLKHTLPSTVDTGDRETEREIIPMSKGSLKSKGLTNILTKIQKHSRYLSLCDLKYVHSSYLQITSISDPSYCLTLFFREKKARNPLSSLVVFTVRAARDCSEWGRCSALLLIALLIREERTRST
jgi:hypothetical protein